MRNATGSFGSRSRRTWVRYRLALTANTKPSGTRAAQERNVALEGIR
jgi:hypothetical protein